MSKAAAAPPIPFWHVSGGDVQPVPLPWQPAAQNMKPSMPVVVPAPSGARSSTKLAAVFWSELLKLSQLGWPPISHRLPVNLAGACAGTDPDTPSTCCCQPVSSAATPVFCEDTMALA